MKFRLTNLRKKHPFFYKRATSLGVLYSYMSLLLLFSYSRFGSSESYTTLRQLVPAPMWGVLYGISGFGILIALNFLRESYVRLFIAIGVGLATMWSLGLLAVFLYGYDVGAVAFALFGFVAVAGYHLVTYPLIDEELETKQHAFLHR